MKKITIERVLLRVTLVGMVACVVGVATSWSMHGAHVTGF